MGLPASRASACSHFSPPDTAIIVGGRAGPHSHQVLQNRLRPPARCAWAPGRSRTAGPGQVHGARAPGPSPRRHASAAPCRRCRRARARRPAERCVHVWSGSSRETGSCACTHVPTGSCDRITWCSCKPVWLCDQATSPPCVNNTGTGPVFGTADCARATLCERSTAARRRHAKVNPALPRRGAPGSGTWL